jgi:hypothetical protein
MSRDLAIALTLSIDSFVRSCFTRDSGHDSISNQHAENESDTTYVRSTGGDERACVMSFPQLLFASHHNDPPWKRGRMFPSVKKNSVSSAELSNTYNIHLRKKRHNEERDIVIRNFADSQEN